MPQFIERPNGISVFGSSRLYAVPDVAEVSIACAEVRPAPEEAFEAVKATSTRVSSFLAGAGLGAADVRMNAAQLDQAFKGYGAEQAFIGYRATIAYNILVADVSQLERVLTGCVAAGANRLERVSHTTRRLAELRANARRAAVAAARAKAELYAEAAGVRLGPVLHVEDRNPAELRQEWGHGARADHVDADTELAGATPPGSIEVAAAVNIVFAIGS
jgi:uncharacterized protein YggE